MVVRAGREFLAIPGPTTMPDEVLRAMHRPALDIYSDQMIDLTDGLLRDLSGLFATKGRSYIYIANGHGAWEGALSNVLSRGDKVLVLESGRFAIGWGNAAAAMGAEVEVLKGDWRRAIRASEVEARLRQDKDHKIKAILAGAGRYRLGRLQRHRGDRQGDQGRGPSGAVHGRCGGVARLHAVRDGRVGHRRCDVRIAEGPDGAARPRLRRRQRARPRGAQDGGLADALLGLDRARRSEHYHKYAGTAPVHLLFALRQSIDMLFEEKLENVFLRHRLLAEAVRRAVAVWAEGQVLSFNITEPAERSDTVTTVVMGGGHDPVALHRYCKEKCGVVLGVGIGELQGQAFRIAHMGHVNAPMMLGTLGVIEVGLTALQIPHGKGGTEAAIDWLGESVSP